MADRVAPDIGHEATETVAASILAGIGDPGEICLPQGRRPARGERPQGLGVVHLLFLGGCLFQECNGLGGGVGSFQINEQPAELGIELAHLRGIVRVEPGDQRAAVDSSGRPKRLRTTS